MKIILNTKGFTLIEFLLYTIILAMVLILAGGFLWDIIFGNIKETSYQEVQQNGRFALSKITQEIKKATGVNTPPPGSSSNNLLLAMANPSLHPTVFDVVDGKLRITQGSNGPYELTSDQVAVTNIQFTDLSYTGTPGTIRMEMTIDYVNPMNRNEYTASASFKSTVSLLKGGATP
jgi:Tfp pilus assembly protein PilW